MQPVDPASKHPAWLPAAIGLVAAACLAALVWAFVLGPAWAEHGWRAPLLVVVALGFAALLLNAIRIIARLGFVAGPVVILVALAALGFAGGALLE